MSKICKLCSKLSDGIDCPKCNNVTYCSQICLTDDLSEHKSLCQTENLSKTYEGIVHVTTNVETKKHKLEFEESDKASDNDKKILSSIILSLLNEMLVKYNSFPNIAFGEYINVDNKDVGYIRVLTSFAIKEENEHFNTFEVRMFKNPDDYKKSKTDFNNSGLAGIEEFYHLITKDYEVKFEISTNKETSTINIQPISTSEPEKKNLGLDVINYAFQNFMVQLENAVDGEVIKVSVKENDDIVHITKKVINENKFEFTVNVFFGKDINLES